MRRDAQELARRGARLPRRIESALWLGRNSAPGNSEQGCRLGAGRRARSRGKLGQVLTAGKLRTRRRAGK
jgi:hypothetical protein